MSEAETRERAAMLALCRVPGLGASAIRRLVDAHGSATGAVRSLARSVEGALEGVRVRGGVRPATLRGLRAIDPDEARADLDRYVGRGIGVRVYGRPEYPVGLADLTDPPPILFTQGRGGFDPDRSVAIVGTRAASETGRARASELAGELARWGWTVVSGMARGIDAAAHEGALDAGGSSIGVLGSGFDRPYPAENRGLFDRMERQGLLVSEFEPDTPPTRMAFPRRNRIIAALGRAVIVAEAGVPSGALITADHALDIGRDVLVVPYRIDDPGGAGCVRLLRQGAGVVAGVRDVFDAVGWLHDRTEPDRASRPRPGSARAPVVDGPGGMVSALVGGALTADELAERLGRPSAEVVAELARLELEGIVDRASTGRFRARAPAE